jgi:uncharacterized protein (TIGR03083 family)
MTTTLGFPHLLRLIEERSAAFRAAVSGAPGLDAPVPTCPEWTVLDLVRHLGEVHRFWAAAVAAGPADVPPAEAETPGAPTELEALLAWSAESTELLLAALRAAGPDRGCWTWWERSQSPRTSGAVARHQVQEATVHTYDAQTVLGTAQPLPPEAALDGVEEFLLTSAAWAAPWPHPAATFDFRATPEGSWRLSLASDGARLDRLTTPAAAAATAAVTGTAEELVLALYGRLRFDALAVEGDRAVLDLLLAWDPEG